MSYSPISFLNAEYSSYAGWYLKLYEAGKTTPLSMATNAAASNFVAKSLINSGGFFTTDGETVFNPFVQQAYDAYLFPTEGEADSNVTTNAIRIAENITPVEITSSSSISSLTVDTMKATDLSAGIIVDCAKYSSSGDYVSGLRFLIVESAVVDGVIDHELDNGRFALLLASDHISLAQAGGIDNQNNDAAFTAANNYSKTHNLKLVIDGFTSNTTTGWTIDGSNRDVEFMPGNSLVPTVDVIPLFIGDSSTQQFNVTVRNPKIVTAGFGVDSAGLIQINFVKNWLLEKPIIDSDRAAANAASAIYNGIATSSECEDGLIILGDIDGTPKAGVHISTASRNVRCVKTRVNDTGVHDTATFGFSPCFDSGGYGGNTFEECHATNAQGDLFFVVSEANATYGDQTGLGNKVINCTGGIAGKNLVRTGTFDVSVVPDSIIIADNVFDGATEDGLQVGAGSVISRGNVFKNMTKSGIRATSDTVDVDLRSEHDRIVNWCQGDNANDNGVILGTTTKVKVSDTVFEHDFSGVTAGNIYEFGTISGKTVSSLTILNPEPQNTTATQMFRFFATPAAGYYDYRNAGAPPSGDQAPNGSRYSRSDGAGVTDNLYVKRGGSWVGIA